LVQGRLRLRLSGLIFDFFLAGIAFSETKSVYPIVRSAIDQAGPDFFCAVVWRMFAFSIVRMPDLGCELASAMALES